MKSSVFSEAGNDSDEVSDNVNMVLNVAGLHILKRKMLPEQKELPIMMLIRLVFRQ